MKSEGGRVMQKSYQLSKKIYFYIAVLGIIGQLAWGLENSWFNTYTYDVITKETWPIALMNGASAVTAAVTTFYMGTVSDRKGCRKPFIRYGYLIWGFTTAGFIVSEFFPTVLTRCLMVVVLDCVMTFFGSTAYDACYNAWTTDISDDSNRGRISSLIQLTPVMAQVILAGAGVVIDRFGYHAFFLTVGMIVSVLGWVIGGKIKDADTLKPREESNTSFREILQCFHRDTIRANQKLYLVLSAVCVLLCAFQVVYAYEMIYANNYLGIPKTYATLLSAAGLPFMIAGSVLAGRACDKGKGMRPMWIAPAVFAAGALVHALATNLAGILVGRALFYAGYMIMNTAAMALFKKYEPADARGRFEGVRMIFMVMLPMIIGPSIGSALIHHFGVKPVIYFTSSLVSLLCYPVLISLQRKTGE
jgi:MFS family permease